jgi:hypothetical protein
VHSEFETINPTKEIWPIISTVAEFNSYFTVSSGNMVFDLLNEPITSEED